MSPRLSIAAVLLLLGSSLLIGPQFVAAGPPRSAAGEVRPAKALVSFESDAALRDFLKRLRSRQRLRANQNMVAYEQAMPAPPAIVAAPAAASADQAPATASITNNQEFGVDEGDIVKARGDLLIILRRGRLFTVSTAGGGLRPIAAIDAFPPGVDASDDWYDEMLVSGDRIAVIGYCYGRGGTEINRFRLSPDGRLRFEDAYDLRSNDYFSSRNYASRLIGHQLVFYTPLYLGEAQDPMDDLPAIRRWSGRPDAPF